MLETSVKNKDRWFQQSLIIKAPFTAPFTAPKLGNATFARIFSLPHQTGPYSSGYLDML